MDRTNIRRGRPRARKKRRAVTLLLVAFGLVAVIGLCGLAVDLGHVCVARSELQNSADAGALAAASVMQDTYDLNESPIPYYVSYSARREAVRYVAENPCRGKTLSLPMNDANISTGDLVLGHYNSTSGTFDPKSTDYNSAELLVRRDSVQNGALPLFFGPLFAVPEVDVHTDAAAYIETDVNGFRVDDEDGKTTCKLLPFTFNISLWTERINEKVDNYTHDPVNQAVYYGPDGIYEIKLYPSRLSPGNFGTLDLGASANSTAVLTRQILYGPNATDLAYYPDNTIKLGEDGTLHLNGETGISAGCKDELAAIKGQNRIIPLFSTISGDGDNADFTVVAFVGVTILDSNLTGSLIHKYVTIQPCFTVDASAVGGGSNGVTSRFIQSPPRLRQTKLRP